MYFKVKKKFKKNDNVFYRYCRKFPPQDGNQCEYLKFKKRRIIYDSDLFDWY